MKASHLDLVVIQAVLWGVLMANWAVGDRCLPISAFGDHVGVVIGLGARTEMTGTYAADVVAEVKERHPFRDGTDGILVGDPVSQEVLYPVSPLDPEDHVPFGSLAARPATGTTYDLGSESIYLLVGEHADVQGLPRRDSGGIRVGSPPLDPVTVT